MHHIVHRTAVLEPYRAVYAAEGIPSHCDWMAGLAGMALKQVLGQMMMLGWAVMNASMLEANMNAVSRCVECARPTRSTINACCGMHARYLCGMAYADPPPLAPSATRSLSFSHVALWPIRPCFSESPHPRLSVTSCFTASVGIMRQPCRYTTDGAVPSEKAAETEGLALPASWPSKGALTHVLSAPALARPTRHVCAGTDAAHVCAGTRPHLRRKARPPLRRGRALLGHR